MRRPHPLSKILCIGCKLFLLTLANYINKDTLLCIPSLETLSRDMGIGIKQTREYKKELIAKGVISCHFKKGYKSPNFTLHLNNIKRVKTTPPQDTPIQPLKNSTTTLGELMNYPINPFITPPQGTLTIIKPLSNPIYESLKKENLDKYIKSVTDYATNLGIDIKNKGINMVEDEIRKLESPATTPLTQEEIQLHLRNALRQLGKGSGGVKIIK